MQKFIEKIRAFMYGRNGIDKLGMFTVFMYLLFNGIKMCFTFNRFVYFSLWAVALLFLAVSVMRFLSKNLEKRRYEAQQFENFLTRIRFQDFVRVMNKKMKRLGIRISQIRTHRFRTCPQCDKHLRLSRKRGVRHITCPGCGRKIKTFVLF